AAHGEPDRGGDHLLLGDVHLEEAVRVVLLGEVRVSGVAHVAVEGDDSGPRTWIAVTPPSSSIARCAMSSGSGFPCQSGSFSTSENPLPLTVRAMMTVGRSARAAASYAAVISSTSCPSIVSERQPNAVTRCAYRSTSQPYSVAPVWPSRLTSRITVKLSSS